MGRKRLKIRWPELGREVLVEPLEPNQMLYDWFLENTPVRSVQGQAVVSGCHLYTMNIRLKKPMPKDHPEWYTERRDEAPVGTVGIFVTAGGVGSILIKWGRLTEIARYPGILGRVRQEDIEELLSVGNEMWDAIYNTKKIITCIFEEA